MVTVALEGRFSAIIVMERIYVIPGESSADVAESMS